MKLDELTATAGQIRPGQFIDLAKDPQAVVQWYDYESRQWHEGRDSYWEERYTIEVAAVKRHGTTVVVHHRSAEDPDRIAWWEDPAASVVVNLALLVVVREDHQGFTTSLVLPSGGTVPLVTTVATPAGAPNRTMQQVDMVLGWARVRRESAWGWPEPDASQAVVWTSASTRAALARVAGRYTPYWPATREVEGGYLAYCPCGWEAERTHPLVVAEGCMGLHKVHAGATEPYRP